MNLNFLFDSIIDLRKKSDELPLIVDEGQQILNDFEWTI